MLNENMLDAFIEMHYGLKEVVTQRSGELQISQEPSKSKCKYDTKYGAQSVTRTKSVLWGF